MHLPERLLPRTITAQIMSLVVVAVLLGIGLTVLMILFFFRPSEDVEGPDAIALRIATVTELARSSRSEAEVDALLGSARRAGMHVHQVRLSELTALRPDSVSIDASFFARLIVERLATAHGITPRGGDANTVVVGLNDRSVLVFEPLTTTTLPLAKLVIVPSTLAVSIIAVFLTLLSAYAVRWITAPLSSIAAAALSFGQSSPEEPMLREYGPWEIRQVARALNDMRIRIRALVDDRTRMLVAISHDLRTPLTRLRLRLERVSDDAMRDRMLHEVTRIDDMLKETLAYFRDCSRTEEVQGVDLPSLLQTVCADFADIGHAVSYEGPDHFAYTCRPGSLTRAIANLVDNGTKHGTTVSVRLCESDSSGIEIDVCDNGPGIPPSLRSRVMEPFVKGDSARGSSRPSGFGLGLSIARDIVRLHGGTFHLFDGATGGLTVRMVLPVQGPTNHCVSVGSSIRAMR